MQALDPPLFLDGPPPALASDTLAVDHRDTPDVTSPSDSVDPSAPPRTGQVTPRSGDEGDVEPSDGDQRARHRRRRSSSSTGAVEAVERDCEGHARARHSERASDRNPTAPASRATDEPLSGLAHPYLGERGLGLVVVGGSTTRDEALASSLVGSERNGMREAEATAHAPSTSTPAGPSAFVRPPRSRQRSSQTNDDQRSSELGTGEGRQSTARGTGDLVLDEPPVIAFVSGAIESPRRRGSGSRTSRSRQSSIATDQGNEPTFTSGRVSPALSGPPLRPRSVASSRSTSTFSTSTRTSNRLVVSDLATTSSNPLSFDSLSPVAAPRARSARRPTGPTTIVGDLLVSQNYDPNRLYFPPPPSASASSLRTKSPTIEPSASFSSSARSSLVQLPTRGPFPTARSTPPPVFPSRSASFDARPAPPLPATFSAPATAPIPSRPFPPPPSRSPQARFVSRVPSYTSDLTASSSTTSVPSSVEHQPVFPTLGAQLNPVDGIVRSGVSSRRISQAPWEGDELDRMMAAQRRTSSAAEGGGEDERQGDGALNAKERDKEKKRKSIYNELMRTHGIGGGWSPQGGAAGAAVAERRKSSPTVQSTTTGLSTGHKRDGKEELDAFQRELFARDTVKKSLGAKLLSEETNLSSSDVELGEGGGSSRRDSYLGFDDAEDDSTLLTPSSSTSSNISTLPSFPDVPSRSPAIAPFPSAKPALRSPKHDTHDEVEIVLAPAAASVSTPSGLAPPVPTPTFTYSFHPNESNSATPSPSRHSTRLSIDSEQSNYEDAQEELPERTSIDAGSLRELAAIKANSDGVATDQTSQWVLETIASAVESPDRRLSDIGEEEAEELRTEQVSTPEQQARPAPTASTANHPASPDLVVPPSPSPSGGATRAIASSTVSSPSAVPPSPALSSPMTMAGRSASPSLSQRSRSTASSIAPVSYTAPPKRPTASHATSSLPKSKLGFGSKLGKFFGGQASYNAAALGLRGSGISSRDVARLERPANDGSTDDPASSVRSRTRSADYAFQAHRRSSSDWDSHTRSTSYSSHGSFTPALFPTTSSNAPIPTPTTPASFTSTTSFASQHPPFRSTFPLTSIFSASPRIGGGGDSTSSRPASDRFSISSSTRGGDANSTNSGAVVAGGGGGDDSVNKLADLLSQFEREERERFKGIATSRSNLAKSVGGAHPPASRASANSVASTSQVVV
ncbi:hypothetical protein JCM10212_003446 [Sporobolomyces blumeae]